MTKREQWEKATNLKAVFDEFPKIKRKIIDPNYLEWLEKNTVLKSDIEKWIDEVFKIPFGLSAVDELKSKIKDSV